MKNRFTFDVEAELSDPIEVLEIHFTLAPVEFPAPGVYAFQLSSAGVPLMERKVKAMYIPEPNE